MINNDITYTIGIPEQFRDSAVKLYSQLFYSKVAIITKHPATINLLVNASLSLRFSIGAFKNDKLIGLAGINTQDGSFSYNKLTYLGLVTILGLLRGSWGYMILKLYQHNLKQNEVFLEGLYVQSKFRGCGVGKSLISEVKRYSETLGLSKVRVNLLYSNNKARELYEKTGFSITKNNRYFLLLCNLGYGSLYTMEYELKQKKI